MAVSVKCLTLLLFHNDEDIIESQLNYYESQKQDIIVFNHNSNDNTNAIIMSNIHRIKHYFILNHLVSFKTNEVHATICKIIKGLAINTDNVMINNKQMTNLDIKNYTINYHWISFPESDEFLEGPNRKETFYQHLVRLYDTNKKGIQYLNYVFWYTDGDDLTIADPVKRMKYYAFFKNCGPRMYTWRANLMPITTFGHTPALNSTPHDIAKWKTKHYDGRSQEHFEKKMNDRKNVTINTTNNHYSKREKEYEKNNDFKINHNLLHYDDGINELIEDDLFNWKERMY